MMGLNRVYRYWLNVENHLSPTREKLIYALRKIKEYTVATTVGQDIKVSLLFTLKPLQELCKATIAFKTTLHLMIN